MKATIFNHVYTFFSCYYHNGDSLSFEEGHTMSEPEVPGALARFAQ